MPEKKLAGRTQKKMWTSGGGDSGESRSNSAGQEDLARRTTCANKEANPRSKKGAREGELE